MTATEFLSRPESIWKKLCSARLKVASLKALTERVTAVFGKEHEPVTHTRNTSAMQDAAIRLSEARDEVADLEIDYAEAVLDVGLVIASVTEPLLHEFLEKRYLEFMTAEGAAKSMNFSESWSRFIHPKAIAAVQKILDEQKSA